MNDPLHPGGPADRPADRPAGGPLLTVAALGFVGLIVGLTIWLAAALDSSHRWNDENHSASRADRAEIRARVEENTRAIDHLSHTLGKPKP